MEKIIRLLNKTGFIYAYDHFTEGFYPELPFICYKINSSSHFAADNKPYFKKNLLNLELYTEKKEPETEKKIEALLEENSIFYRKSEIYLASEKMLEILYQFEMEE